MKRIVSGILTATSVTLFADPASFSLGVNEDEVAGFFSPFFGITANGENFQFVTYPSDRSVGIGFGTVSSTGDTVDAWFLEEGGLGSVYLNSLPGKPSSLAAYFMRDDAIGFALFDKESLEPEFAHAKSVIPAAWFGQRIFRMNPLPSGKASFVEDVDNCMIATLIDLDGSLIFDTTLKSN